MPLMKNINILIFDVTCKNWRWQALYQGFANER